MKKISLLSILLTITTFFTGTGNVFALDQAYATSSATGQYVSGSGSVFLAGSSIGVSPNGQYAAGVDVAATAAYNFYGNGEGSGLAGATIDFGTQANNYGALAWGNTSEVAVATVKHGTTLVASAGATNAFVLGVNASGAANAAELSSKGGHKSLSFVSGTTSALTFIGYPHI